MSHGVQSELRPGYGMDSRRILVRFLPAARNSHFPKTSILALGAHSAVPEALFPGVKRTGREVNHVSPPSAVVNHVSPPSAVVNHVSPPSAIAKNAWSYTCICFPSSAFLAWRGTNLNSYSRCEQKQLSYLNKNRCNSKTFYKIIQCEISWKFIRRFSCCYTNRDRRTAVY